MSENIFKKNIEIKTESGLTKRTSSEKEYSPQKPQEPHNKAREIEAAVYSSNVHMNKPAGAQDSSPPDLTDSESESDSESEPGSDQEYIVEETSSTHQLDSDPDVTDIANAIAEPESDQKYSWRSESEYPNEIPDSR